MSDSPVQRLAALETAVAGLQRGRTTHKVATVTAVDDTAGTFSVSLPEGQTITGVDDRDAPPTVGQQVRLRLEGATILYEPGPTGYAPDGAGGLYQSTKVSGEGARYATTDSVTGATTASMVGGLITAGDLTVVNEPTFAGRSLTTWMADRPVITSRWGNGNASSARSSGTEVAYGEYSVTLQRGRRYKLCTSHMRMTASANGMVGCVNIRYTTAEGTTTPATPSLTSPLVTRAYVQIPYGIAAGVPSMAQPFHTPDGTGPQSYRFLISHQKVEGAAGDLWLEYSGADPIAIWTEDLGPNTVQNLVYSDGSGGAVAPAPTNQVLEVKAAWTKSLRGDGTFRGDTADAYQGYYPDGVNGNQQAFIGFPDVTGTLSGATLSKVSVYLYAEHWYYADGGTGVIGVHGYSSEPTSPNSSLHRPDLVRVSGWARGQDKWVDLPSTQYADILSGAVRGVMVGPGPTTSGEYYGRFAGPTHAIWRFEYTK
jgi:hypothetical protein